MLYRYSDSYFEDCFHPIPRKRSRSWGRHPPGQPQQQCLPPPPRLGNSNKLDSEKTKVNANPLPACTPLNRLNHASSPCHWGNSSLRSRLLKAMVNGIKNTVTNLDTLPIHVPDAHKHRHHVRHALSPAVSHTYADQRQTPPPPPL